MVLEGKLADAESLNNNLQAEIDRAKADSAANERSLQQQLKEQQQELEQLRSRGGEGGGEVDSEQYQELLQQHEDLKTELKEQEEVSFRHRDSDLMLNRCRLRRKSDEKPWSSSIR
jgi:hypothetical protein